MQWTGVLTAPNRRLRIPRRVKRAFVETGGIRVYPRISLIDALQNRSRQFNGR